MTRQLQVGDKVLIKEDGDICSSLLPCVGYVVHIDEHSCSSVWISSDPTYSRDRFENVCTGDREEDLEFFCLSYEDDVLYQTEDGIKTVILYENKDYNPRLKGICKFLRKVKEDYHAV
jgi:hypothetical protein